ncbi:HNH endonuclease [Chitinophaga sp. sic0106]|uniref:HNH endonuclease n=1 Tax=Chitinophaga sp. sic0106 TaxID=2854785 RepID=UPI001C470DF4|nr:HNH endonuclease [Chitinophaga sp. sic0106]
MGKINRQAIFEKYDGHCAYCGREMVIADMQVDHIRPKCIGGNDAEANLNPSCRKCNHYKRATTLEGFRFTMRGLHHRISKIYIHQVAVNFGMATLAPFDGKFYFEKISPAPAPVTGTEQ